MGRSPGSVRDASYENHPLPTGHGQTISQPYIVALMTSLAKPAKAHIVLEVGTGSSYQPAVISRLVSRVVSIEIVEPLAREAAEPLKKAGASTMWSFGPETVTPAALSCRLAVYL